MAKLAINEGKSVEFNLSKNWLNNVDEVAVMKPVLSNPAMHWPLLTGLPFVTLVPKYFTSVNAFKVGSHEPISKGLNSKRVAFKFITVVPGYLPSATVIGKGISPFLKTSASLKVDHVYPTPPRCKLGQKLYARARPQTSAKEMLKPASFLS